jgi:catechol 2,3-dioxygenase-like lactoylglutathione lyase family enzyme
MPLVPEPHRIQEKGETMIDHVNLNVRDWTASRAFYAQALAVLGYDVVKEWDGAASGFGRDDRPTFFIERRDPVSTGIHVAFTADDRATVDAFHAAALAAGGTDNGAPGIRWYHPNYYGAFVLDPDGNNVEAVCHHG